MPSQLKLSNVSVTYGSVTAANNISLSLQPGEIGCLLGPSGCGKTTVLRAIAGFEQVSAGEVTLHNRVIAHPGFSLPPEQRKVGMVFQDFALFPHLNISKNIAFGLNTLSRAKQHNRIEEMLQLVGLSEQANRYPHQLSGGQQQRVALARALAPEPEILLLDEPFSSLDGELREQLAGEVRELLKASDVTAILVTHDQYEAFAMADKVTLLKDGQVAQTDTPYALYHHPANEFVATFVGQGSIISIIVGGQGELERELDLTAGCGIPRKPGQQLNLLIRPEDLRYNATSNLRLKIVGRSFRGTDCLYQLLLEDGQQVPCLAPNHIDATLGETLPVHFEPRQIVLFEN